MYKGQVKLAFSDPHLRSGPMIPPPGFYPHTGSTLMDVCLRSFSSSSVVLISILAIPTVQYFLQSNVIYIGGDSDAFHSRYPAPVTRIVSLRSLSCHVLTNTPPRRWSSSNSHFPLNSAPTMGTSYRKDYLPPEPNLFTLLLPLLPLD